MSKDVHGALKYIADKENGGFIALNKTLIKELGLHEAILLGCLASKYNYWYEHNGLDEDDFFYAISEDIENETTLSYHQQLTAFKHLEQTNIIITKKQGLPSKKYFKINEQMICKILNINVSDSETQGFKKLKPKGLKNSTQNKNKYNKNNNITLSKDKVTQTEVCDIKNDDIKNDTDNNIDNINIDNNINDNINNNTENISLNDNIDNNDKNTSSHTFNSEEEIILDGKIVKKSTKSYKKIMSYIDSLCYNDAIKSDLKEWFKTIGVGLVNIKQLESKLKRLCIECNYDMNLIGMAIKNALDNNWRAFYKPNTYHVNKSIQNNITGGDSSDIIGKNYGIGRKVDTSKWPHDKDGNLYTY